HAVWRSFPAQGWRGATKRVNYFGNNTRFQLHEVGGRTKMIPLAQVGETSSAREVVRIMKRILFMAAVFFLAAGTASADYVLIKVNINQMNFFPEIGRAHV